MYILIKQIYRIENYMKITRYFFTFESRNMSHTRHKNLTPFNGKNAYCASDQPSVINLRGLGRYMRWREAPRLSHRRDLEETQLRERVLLT